MDHILKLQKEIGIPQEPITQDYFLVSGLMPVFGRALKIESAVRRNDTTGLATAIVIVFFCRAEERRAAW